MTILNWLYWKKQQLIKKTANNAETDLIVLGAEVPFTKRDDGYQDYAMSLKDATQSGCVANNTLATGILDTFPYVITPGLNKTATQVIDPTTGLTLEGWKVEGTVILSGSVSYSQYLGTVTIKNYDGSPLIPFNTTGTVSYDTTLPNVQGFEPLGLFNSALIGGFGDYAQFSFTTTTTTVGTDLLIDIDLYASPAPMTVGTGNLEATVSFKIETLIAKGLDVMFNI